MGISPAELLWNLVAFFCCHQPLRKCSVSGCDRLCRRHKQPHLFVGGTTFSLRVTEPVSALTCLRGSLCVLPSVWCLACGEGKGAARDGTKPESLPSPEEESPVRARSTPNSVLSALGGTPGRPEGSPSEPVFCVSRRGLCYKRRRIKIE